MKIIHLFRLASLVALACVTSSHAAPLTTPFDVKVINSAATPVPVTVVQPVVQPVVTCRVATFSSIGLGPFVSIDYFSQWSTVLCPDGVTAVNVERVLFVPTAKAAPNYVVSIGFGIPPSANVSEVFAVVSNGNPERLLPRTTRLSLSDTRYLRVKATCGTGLTFEPNFQSGGSSCDGTIYFIGSAAQ